MAYEKRVCVLKQIKKGFSADGGALTGAVYAERLSEELTVTPKIPAAPLSEGRYCLGVWADGQIFCLEYANAVTLEKAPSLARGFAALLCFVRTEAEPVAYGCCGEAPRDYTPLLNAINRMEEAAPEKKRKHAAKAEERAEKEAESETACFRAQYDDEAIATADYFALSQSNEDAAAPPLRQKEAAKEGADVAENEGDSAYLPPRGSLVYYHEVKEKLDTVFALHPRDERLKAVFPASEWVNSGGALLGVIYEEGTPRYLCVAVEAKGEPPAEVKDRGVFVPSSQFSDEEGFYVVVHDAETGEYVRVYAA